MGLDVFFYYSTSFAARRCGSDPLHKSFADGWQGLPLQEPGRLCYNGLKRQRVGAAAYYAIFTGARRRVASKEYDLHGQALKGR